MQTLAQIVNENPAAARVLERHHLDHCRGGSRTLERACADAQADLDQVQAELSREFERSEPADWTGMAPAELVDHIETTHHHYLHDELPRLDALAATVAGVDATRHAELTDVARLVSALRADLEPHMAKEERVLFPMIRERSTSW